MISGGVATVFVSIALGMLLVGCAARGAKPAQGGAAVATTGSCAEPEDCNRRCSGGEAAACTTLGRMYGTTRGVPQDFARADSLYERGCEGGDARGCSWLGESLDNGWGAKKDYARAANLFRRGCDGRDARGCSGLGVMYEQGHGVPRDREKAIVLFQMGCDGGNAWGCRLLGYTREGDHLDPTPIFSRAVTLYKRECEADANGCLGLALLYRHGSAPFADPPAAAQLYAPLCARGEALA
jgi:TPR repeat protein